MFCVFFLAFMCGWLHTIIALCSLPQCHLHMVICMINFRVFFLCRSLVFEGMCTYVQCPHLAECISLHMRVCVCITMINEPGEVPVG